MSNCLPNVSFSIHGLVLPLVLVREASVGWPSMWELLTSQSAKDKWLLNSQTKERGHWRGGEVRVRWWGRDLWKASWTQDPCTYELTAAVITLQYLPKMELSVFYHGWKMSPWGSTSSWALLTASGCWRMRVTFFNVVTPISFSCCSK